MYSNTILNFQVSTTILNARTNKPGNLLNTPHTHTHIYIYIYIYIYISQLIIIEDDPKAHFSIATTPKSRDERNLFSWIAPLTPDLYLIMWNVKQGDTKYHFLFFGITRPEIEPWSPGPLVNTQPTMTLGQYIYIYIYIYARFMKDIYIYIHIYICVCVCVCLYVCVCVCVLHKTPSIMLQCFFHL